MGLRGVGSVPLAYCTDPPEQGGALSRGTQAKNRGGLYEHQAQNKYWSCPQPTCGGEGHLIDTPASL